MIDAKHGLELLLTCNICQNAYCDVHLDLDEMCIAYCPDALDVYLKTLQKASRKMQAKMLRIYRASVKDGSGAAWDAYLAAGEQSTEACNAIERAARSTMIAKLREQLEAEAK